MILKANKMCPYCGKEIWAYNERDWKYGSPIRNCKGCGKKYLDTRYHEIAIDGIAPNALNAKSSAMSLVFGLGFIIIPALVNLAFIYCAGYYSFMLVMLSLVGVLIIIMMLIDIIRIKTGSKERRLEKLKSESEQRLQNTLYVQELQDVGIVVPDEYIY